MKTFTLLLFLLVGWMHHASAQTLTFYANISGAYTEGNHWVGHVWVGLKDASGQEQRLGFNRQGLIPETGTSDIAYTFPLNSNNHQRVLSTITQFRQRRYTLGINDCRSFALAIAQAAGLNTPRIQTTDSPAFWLANLVDLN